jgi:hypothetical protein
MADVFHYDCHGYFLGLGLQMNIWQTHCIRLINAMPERLPGFRGLAEPIVPQVPIGLHQRRHRRSGNRAEYRHLPAASKLDLDNAAPRLSPH